MAAAMRERDCEKARKDERMRKKVLAYFEAFDVFAIRNKEYPSIRGQQIFSSF
jgi:hypothetical protein